VTWPLRVVEFPMTPEERETLAPGDCWRVPLTYAYRNGQTFEDIWGGKLSARFRQSGRDHVIFVRLPGGFDWSPDLTESSDLQPGRPMGWAVVGDLPGITVHPSVNAVGFYHGFIADGVVGDDLEGRTYD
jgi:hypothetical protein